MLWVVLLFSSLSVAQKNSFKPRIVGGEAALQGQFPFFASISGLVDAATKTYLPCGGSLISPTLVLTSAQCCLCDQPAKAVLFEVSLNAFRYNRSNVSVIADSCTETFVSTQRQCHPDWSISNDSPGNDFCMITLQRASVYTPIGVYDSRKTYIYPHPDAESQMVVITGFGDTKGENADADYPNTLQKAIISITNPDNCTALWAPYGINVNSPGLVCGDASGPKSICFGDVGGPMFTKLSTGKFLLLGVSFFTSPNCNDENLPSIFSRVDTASFRNWAWRFTSPFRLPTVRPSWRPSNGPTTRPSKPPSVLSSPTTRFPTRVPTFRPSKSPTTNKPTKEPTIRVTPAPTFTALCVNKQFP